MAYSKLSFLCIFFPFFILFLSSSLASSLAPTYYTPESICDTYTSFPDFCLANLPYDRPRTIHEYARISISQSLSSAQQILSFVEHYLSLPSILFKSVIYALEDCQFLAQLNIDALSLVSQILGSSDSLPSLQACDLHTLLSATLTNLETCVDGLEEPSTPALSILNGILPPLFNGRMHYSVSLALFKLGWVHDTGKGRFLTERELTFADMGNGADQNLPLRMSIRDRQLYESVSGRTLLQDSKDSLRANKFVVVNPYGDGHFTTVSEAVAAAPDRTNISNGYFVIYVVAGVYNEYVSIPRSKQYVMLIGEGINRTVITGNRSVVDGWTTFNSATFAVVGQGFVAVNITFRNTAGAIKHQAVAVRNGADMSTFYRCSIEGYQDTLYAHSLRQFYRDCEIYGTVDYIFGNAAAVFQNCTIHSRLPMDYQFNAVTAQGRTDPNQNTGTSIQGCSIRAAQDLASNNGSTKTYLGRPWKEYSRTVFMQSFIDESIDPAGWVAWSGDFALSTLYYAEFNNTGPGSNVSNRTTWPGYHVINGIDAANFTASNFIQAASWLQATGVPYIGGLQ